MRILLGTGTTDANGNVTVTYTGSGAGKVQLMAECGDIQSEQYTLYDVSFKDIGTEDDYTAWTSDSNFTVSRSDAETTITPTDTTAFASRYLTISSYTVPFVIEFDFNLSFTGNASYTIMSIRQGTSSKGSITPNALGLTSGEYSHIKLTVTSTELQINVDGTDKTPLTHDGTFNRFYITQNANTLWQSIKYKNFIIYPI